MFNPLRGWAISLSHLCRVFFPGSRNLLLGPSPLYLIWFAPQCLSRGPDAAIQRGPLPGQPSRRARPQRL